MYTHTMNAEYPFPPEGPASNKINRMRAHRMLQGYPHERTLLEEWGLSNQPNTPSLNILPRVIYLAQRVIEAINDDATRNKFLSLPSGMFSIAYTALPEYLLPSSSFERGYFVVLFAAMSIGHLAIARSCVNREKNSPPANQRAVNTV